MLEMGLGMRAVAMGKWALYGGKMDERRLKTGIQGDCPGRRLRGKGSMPLFIPQASNGGPTPSDRLRMKGLQHLGTNELRLE